MYYQLAFLTPGISPFQASSLKQIRHVPNRRKNPRGLPHKVQRLCFLVENLGTINDLLIKPFLAMKIFAFFNIARLFA